MIICLTFIYLGYGWVIISKEESLIKIDPENLSVILMQVSVASKINLLLHPFRRESPYKSILF